MEQLSEVSFGFAENYRSYNCSASEVSRAAPGRLRENTLFVDVTPYLFVDVMP
jgi:hypothetical protein